ncbi:MAG: tRNA pseudouridine(55) synthase TruB [Campylobacteraceae bacterium]|nr:tRNA pseudouridine(55) synthase TruB [Campylobacteraceae bacterium]
MSVNRLFTAYKPSSISCNGFLRGIKKKYGVKKVGYSGTLDPFASGNLIIAFGQYTKLFRFLKKSPKRYRAVLWLGAKSCSLDIERVESVDELEPFDIGSIREAAKSLTGRLTYVPPKFSAKKIDGKRAYELARLNKDVVLKEITTEVFCLEIKDYNHPFITFEADVSEGGYIRSIGQMLAEKLGANGALKSLERLSEGEFFYDEEKELNPLDFLSLSENFYLKDKSDILLGRKLKKTDFQFQEEREYFLRTDNYLSIIKIGCEAEYLLNKIELC